MLHFAFFKLFPCPYQKNVVYLRSQFHAGDVCMSSAGVADIFKRRLLTLCSGVFETSQLSKASSGLSNDICPTGYRLYLLCQFWLSFAHTYVCAQAITLSIYDTRVYLYSAWASALSVQRCRQCEGLENVERQQSDSTLFLYALTSNNNPHSWEFLCTTWH